MLEGLKYIHNSGIIHDDIKPDNILLQSTEREDEFDRVKICDFGLSYITDPHQGKVKAEVKCGTIGYIAPDVQEVSILCF